jgi:hypothetical protein
MLGVGLQLKISLDRVDCRLAETCYLGLLSLFAATEVVDDGGRSAMRYHQYVGNIGCAQHESTS